MPKRREAWTMGIAAVLWAVAALGLPPAQAAEGERAAPQTFSGVVTRVSDGDTLWVQPDDGAPGSSGAAPTTRRKPIKLRLVGIDAPERCQAHGDVATRALSDLVLHQRVTVRRRATDDYGRALGTLWRGDLDVSAQLVRDGHAWSARYRRDLGPYAREEQAARAARRGLFADASAQLPRDFRREHGPCP